LSLKTACCIWKRLESTLSWVEEAAMPHVKMAFL